MRVISREKLLRADAHEPVPLPVIREVRWVVAEEGVEAAAASVVVGADEIEGIIDGKGDAGAVRAQIRAAAPLPGIADLQLGGPEDAIADVLTDLDDAGQRLVVGRRPVTVRTEVIREIAAVRFQGDERLLPDAEADQGVRRGAA